MNASPDSECGSAVRRLTFCGALPHIERWILDGSPLSFMALATPSLKFSARDVVVFQCEPSSAASRDGVRCRVQRDDGTELGEFRLAQGDDGWLPVPIPGSLHPGLAHSTAIEFAEAVNAGRIALD